MAGWRAAKNVLAVTILGVLMVIGPGCLMYASYAVYDSHTPLRKVPPESKYWGGYELGRTYTLRETVFLANLRYYSHGPGLAPGKEFRPEKRDPQWWGESTTDQYRNDPSVWKEAMGLVEKGTRIECVAMKHSRYFVVDVRENVPFGEILDGPRKGLVVDLTELSLYVDHNSWLVKPNPAYLGAEVEEEETSSVSAN